MSIEGGADYSVTNESTLTPSRLQDALENYWSIWEADGFKGHKAYKKEQLPLTVQQFCDQTGMYLATVLCGEVVVHDLRFRDAAYVPLMGQASPPNDSEMDMPSTFHMMQLRFLQKLYPEQTVWRMADVQGDDSTLNDWVKNRAFGKNNRIIFLASPWQYRKVAIWRIEAKQ